MIGMEAVVEVILSTDRGGDVPLLNVRCEPDEGDVEMLSVR